jgi:hypothetical protein
MRTPPNPCTWFGNGGSWGDQEPFTYEGGTTLFYFAPSVEVDKKVFSHWVPISLLFLANDEEHAKNVIERMLKFRQEVNARHEKYLGHKDFTRMTGDHDLPTILLKNKEKWIVTKAPSNQFYKIGWADNDTIL